MNFKQSDKVVCLNASIHPEVHHFDHPNGYIKLGAVYCVEGVTDGGGIVLVGKPCKWREDGEEVGWHAWRFREVSEHRRIEQMIADLNRKREENQ